MAEYVRLYCRYLPDAADIVGLTWPAMWYIIILTLQAALRLGRRR